MGVAIKDLSPAQIEYARRNYESAQSTKVATEEAGRAALQKRQELALDRELAAAQAKLIEMTAGEQRIAASVTERYGQVAAARRNELIAVKEQVAAQEKLAAAEAAAAKEAVRAQEQAAAAVERRVAREVAADDRAAAAYQRYQAQQAAGAQRRLGPNLQAAGRALTGAVTMPILAGGGIAVAGALAVQGADVEVEQRTGASGAQLAALEASVKRVGATVPQSLQQVGAAIGDLAVRTNLGGAALEGLTRTELNLARITHGDVNETVLRTTQLFTAWHFTAAQMVPALDLLEKAHQRTGANVQQLAANLAKFGPTLQQWGIGFVQATALLAEFQKANVPAERVMAGFTSGLSRLAKAGITDAHQAFQILVKDLSDTQHPMKAIEEATRLFGARVGSRLVAEIQSGRFNVQALERDLLHSAGTIDETAKRSETFAVRFRQAFNQALIAVAPLGVELLKLATQVLQAAQPAIQWLSRMVDAFSHLSPGVKTTTLEVLAFAAAVGPLLGGLGRLVTGARALQGVFAGLAAAAGAEGGVAAVLGGPLVLAIGTVVTAVGLLVTAWVRDWGDIQEKTRAAWKTISDGVNEGTSGIRAVWEGIAGPVKSATAGMMDDIHTALETAMPGITGLWDRFVGNLEKRWQKGRNTFQQDGGIPGALLNALTPGGLGTSIVQHFTSSQAYQQNLAAEEARKHGMVGMGALHGYEAQTAPRNYGPFLAPGITLAGFAPSGDTGPRQSDAEARARMAKTGAGREKLTPLQREQKQYAEELAQAHVRLAEVLAGEDNVTARLQAHYHLLHLSGRDDLVVTEQRIRAVEKHTAQQKKFHDALEAVNAKIRDLTTYHGAAKIEHDFPGTTPTQRKTYQEREAYAAHLKELSDASKRAEEEDTRSVTVLTDKLRDLDREYLKLTHSRERDQVAMQLNNKLYREEDQFHRNLINQIVAHTRRNDELSASLKTENDVFNRLHEALAKDREDRARLFGTSRELTTAQQLLNEAWATGDAMLLQMAEALEDAARQTDRLKQAQDRAKEEGKAQEAGFQALFDSLNRHRQALVDLDLEYQKLTHGSLRDQVALNSEYKTTYDKLPAAIQAWVDAQVKGIEKIRKESEKLSFLRKLAEGTQQVFTQMFTDLAEHGFKGFFRNVLQNFKQLLVQLAAEALAARLTDAIFGKADAQGNRGTQGRGGAGRSNSGGGGLLDLLTKGAQMYAESQGGGGGISAASAQQMFDLPAMAGGGYVAGGRPVLVGERGPELYIPPQAGRIVPHAGGGDTHHNYNIVMNVTTPDAAGFRQNQSALIADLGRAIDRARRTHG